MVTQNGIDTVFGMESTKYLHELLQLGRTLIHQVAREKDNVCLLFIHSPYQFFQNIRHVLETARVNVGNLQHPVAIETLWKIGYVHLYLIDHKVAQPKDSGIQDHAEKAKTNDGASNRENAMRSGLRIEN